MTKEEFRQEAALRILCSISDRIELPEIQLQKFEERIRKNISIDNINRDAACFTAVQYADRLIQFLDSETEYK